MWRIVRGVLWVAKGMLLAIALGALCLWPWSYWHRGSIWGERYTPRAQHVEMVGFVVAWGDGRIGIGNSANEFRNHLLFYGRARLATCGTGWNWTVKPNATWFMPGGLVAPTSPLRWDFYDQSSLGSSQSGHNASVACSLLALLAGAWPISSFLLWNRRRARLRRLARAGCCAHCGYDLRATPESGGERLTRCPECGTASAHKSNA